uniref:Uncharacterized protein n=1 Tax=Oncorhynchus kisutch TaxID=8019 RepID=A0A8C7CZP8_ONCKI
MKALYVPCLFQGGGSQCHGPCLVACLLNISEVRRKDLVETGAEAAIINSTTVAAGLTEWVSGTSAFFFGWTINCNITIDTQDLALGRSNAMAIRGPTRGALSHNGSVEISCNPWPTYNIGGQPCFHTPASLITARMAELAGQQWWPLRARQWKGPPPHECRGLKGLVRIHCIHGIGYTAWSYSQPGRFWPPSDKPEHCLT